MAGLKRERVLLTAALAVAALLALDHSVVSPVLERRAALDQALEQAREQSDQAQSLLGRRKEMSARWRQLVKDGVKPSPAEAESQILHFLRTCAQESGLSLASLRPDKAVDHKGLKEITVRVAGSGPMKAALGFLWRIETGAAPARVTELTLGARKEGLDDLSLQLRVSTLCQTAGKDNGGGAAKDAKDAGADNGEAAKNSGGGTGGAAGGAGHE